MFGLKGDPMPLCRGHFWDHQLTWNTTNPNLTECFRDTVLVLVPVGILAAFLPLWTANMVKLNRSMAWRTPPTFRYGNGLWSYKCNPYITIHQ